MRRKTKGTKKLTFFIVAILIIAATYMAFFGIDNYYGDTRNVYVKGADGLLEKRYVSTGKSLWGSYTEILSGLTSEDLIAFPYGKNVKAGAETREADISELYGY